jgi:hypothetical protein
MRLFPGQLSPIASSTDELPVDQPFGGKRVRGWWHVNLYKPGMQHERQRPPAYVDC